MAKWHGSNVATLINYRPRSPTSSKRPTKGTHNMAGETLVGRHRTSSVAPRNAGQDRDIGIMRRSALESPAEKNTRHREFAQRATSPREFTGGAPKQSLAMRLAEATATVSQTREGIEYHGHCNKAADIPPWVIPIISLQTNRQQSKRTTLSSTPQTMREDNSTEPNALPPLPNRRGSGTDEATHRRWQRTN